MSKTTLENIELHHDKAGYYLSAEYLIETETEVAQLRIPRIAFEVDTGSVTIHQTDHIDYIDIGLIDSLPLSKGRDKKTGKDVYYIREIIETKTKEMTVAEIEKKLGYKIKIVSEDKKNG